MSDSTAIALIIANFLPLLFIYYCFCRSLRNISSEIVTGVVGGVRVPTMYRWILLFQHWLGQVTAVIGCALVLVIMNVIIASYETSASVTTLAYVPVFVGGVTAIGWIGTAIVEMSYYRSVIRQAEAD
jgi:hypothetical protein